MYSLGGSDKTKRKAKLRRLLKKYDETYEAYLFKGTRFATEHERIEADYQRARKALINFVIEG
jgi:hypothetical protein